MIIVTKMWVATELVLKEQSSCLQLWWWWGWWGRGGGGGGLGGQWSQEQVKLRQWWRLLWWTTQDRWQLLRSCSRFVFVFVFSLLSLYLSLFLSLSFTLVFLFVFILNRRLCICLSTFFRQLLRSYSLFASLSSSLSTLNLIIIISLRYYVTKILSHWDIISGRRVEGLEQRIGNQDNANRCPIQSFHNLEEFLSTFFAVFSFLFNIWWAGTSWSRWWSCSKTSRCRWRNRSRSVDNFDEHIV